MIYIMTKIYDAFNLRISAGQVSMWAKIDIKKVRVRDFRMRMEQGIRRRIKKDSFARSNSFFNIKKVYITNQTPSKGPILL